MAIDKEKFHILIVDDTIDIADMNEMILANDGYQVEKAYGSKEAIELVKKSRPDLILSDVMMPDLSGPEMLGMLDKDDKTKDIPTILVTAASNYCDEVFIDCLKKERATLLSKPYNVDALLKAVETKLENIIPQKGRQRFQPPRSSMNPGLFVQISFPNTWVD